MKRYVNSNSELDKALHIVTKHSINPEEIKRMQKAVKSQSNPAQHVANGFLEVMHEEDFDTFEEMKQCYWWNSQDIKDEVEAYLREIDWYISDDGSEVFHIDAPEGQEISYKSLMSQVYRLIKAGGN